jgi:hypothetical protein
MWRLPCGCEPKGEPRCEEAHRLRERRDSARRLAEAAEEPARTALWRDYHRAMVDLEAHLSRLVAEIAP